MGFSVTIFKTAKQVTRLVMMATRSIRTVVSPTVFPPVVAMVTDRMEWKAVTMAMRSIRTLV